MRRLRIVVSTAALVASSLPPAAHAFTFLALQSEPGDFVGQGQTLHLDVTDGAFTAWRNDYYDGVSIDVQDYDPTGGSLASLDFSAPFGAELAVGAFENATRLPFQPFSAPGLSVVVSSNGCNTLTGRFEVLEAVFGPGGEVVRFAANFEQHCEGAEPALFGQLRFDSTIPEPSTALLLGAGLASLALRGRRDDLRRSPPNPSSPA